MQSDEQTLIQEAQGGDASACGKLFDNYYDVIFRYCYYRVGDVQQAQDLASEVFCRMVEKLDSFRYNGRPLLAWLYTIARNLVTDSHRRNGRVQHLPLDQTLAATQDSPHRQMERQQLTDCLLSSLQHLTEDQRQVILLKFVEDLDNARAALILDKTEGAVKSLQHRALAALKRAMEKERCYEFRV